MAELIIIDTQQLQYGNELLQLTVLGGIRLEGLDRMRVTIKVEVKGSPRPPFRHTVDLYNDTQLEKFIRKCAEKLETGTLVIAASLSELTEKLEQYRLEQIKQQGDNNKPKIKPPFGVVFPHLRRLCVVSRLRTRPAGRPARYQAMFKN